jgi:hypothetical protein
LFAIKFRHVLSPERGLLFQSQFPAGYHPAVQIDSEIDETLAGKLQIPNSKLQRSTKLQAQKPTCAPFAPASDLGFGVWDFELLGSLG